MLPFLTRLDCYFYSEALLCIIDTVLHGAGFPIVYSLWIKHRWDTVFPICRSFITFSATSAYLYSCSKELQLKWQAWYYCWMWGTMWGCSCLQLGAAVQEPYLVGIINWWGMCMDQLSKCNCIVHMQRQGLRLGACMWRCRCTSTVWHRLHGWREGTLCQCVHWQRQLQGWRLGALCQCVHWQR